ncbi:NAD(P)-binding protein [Lactarius sanguifluus]|nr:NAD(P)-binding protein [Lactarius sanguifluus]
MRVVILGGTGPSGILLIEEALAARHTIVVYARNPQKLPVHLSKHPEITIVLEAMRRAGVKRLIALGTTSTKDELDKFSIGYSVMGTIVFIGARSMYRDIAAVGEVIRESEDIDWTIVRVPILKNDKNREVRAGYIGDGAAGAAYTLARQGFAAFVLQELDKGEWIKRAPLITSA